MKIIVNGKEQLIDSTSIELLELIKRNDVKQPDMVSIQINGSFIARTLFSQTEVKDGDEIDFLYFMGGGAKKKFH